jgi:hypothetical protein
MQSNLEWEINWGGGQENEEKITASGFTEQYQVLLIL